MAVVVLAPTTVVFVLGLAAYGVARTIGEVTIQAVWPRPGAATDAGESAPNNASVVLVAEVGGVERAALERTLNLGVGMVALVEADDADRHGLHRRTRFADWMSRVTPRKSSTSRDSATT